MNHPSSRPTLRPLVAALALLSAAVGKAGDSPADTTVAERYPFLVSGVLTCAHAVNLPEGVLARSGEVTITAADVREAIEAAPHFAREGLERDPVPALEQALSERLLVVLAREDVKAKGESLPADDKALVESYRGRLSADVKPTEVDLRAFYESNQEALSRLPFEQVKGYVETLLLEQQRQQRVDAFVRDLGRTRRIEVSSAWLTAHAAAGLDNPIDRLRGQGKPILAVFSAASCCGPDKMKPVLAAVGQAVGEAVRVVYVETRDNQALGIRHRVTGIPTVLVFDAQGMELFRRQGFTNAEMLLEWIRPLQGAAKTGG